MFADVDSSEVANRIPDDTSCTTEEVAVADENSWSGTNVDEDVTELVDCTAVDESTEVVGCKAVLDDTDCADVDSSEVANRIPDDTSCTTEEVAVADENSWSGTNVDEDVTGLVDSTAEDEGTDGVGWTAVLDDTACVDTDSSEVGNGVLDDTSCMTEEVAIADEDSWSGTNVDEEVTGVLDSTAEDESTEVVGWTAVLDDTACVDVDSSEIANRIPDDTSFTTEEAAIGDEDSWSATNIDEDVTGLVDSTAVDESTEVVGCTAVLDDTVGGDVDSSEIANRIPDDTSFTTEEAAIGDEDSWSATNIDEDVTGLVDSTAVDESTEVVGCTAVLDDTVGGDVDSSEIANRIPDDTSFTTEEAAIGDEDSWSATNIDEVVTGLVDSTAVDESTEVVGCTAVLDDTDCADVDSSEVANRIPDDTSCTTEEVAVADENSWSGTNVDENVTGVVDSTAEDEGTDVVGWTAVLDDTACVDTDSSEVGNGVLDDTSFTTEEVAIADEACWSGTNFDEGVTGVVNSTAEDESTEVVGCTAVLDDTMFADVDSSEVANRIPDDTSCTTEEVAVADENSWSGTNVDEDVTGVVDSTALDERTEVVGWTAVLDDTDCVDVDSSDIANRIPDDTSFTTEEAAIGDEDSWSATNIDEDVTGLVDSTAVDESTEVVGCTAVLDDTVDGDVDSSEVANRIPDDTSCTTEEVAVADEDSWSGTNVDEEVIGVLDSTAADGSTEVVDRTAVLDDTVGVDTDSSEVGNRIPDDTSFTTEEVAVADEDSWSGTNVDEEVIGVLDSTAADGSTEVVDRTAVLDDTVGVDDVDSSEIANRIPDDTSCTTEEVAIGDEDSWSATNIDEVVTGLVDSTAVDESTEVVDCIAVLDDTDCADVDSSEVANRIPDDTSCTTEEVAVADENSWSGTNVDEDVTGLVDSTAEDEGTDGVGWTAVLDDTACVDTDSSEVGNGVLDDTSCMTEEVAIADEDSWSGTNVDEGVTGVVDSTAADEGTDVVGWTAVLDDTACVDTDSSEVGSGILDDTSCTTEEVAIIDEDCWSGTNVDEDVTELVDFTAVDESTEVVGCKAVLDDTDCADVDSSEVANRIPDDTSCTTEEVAVADENSWSGTNVDEEVTGVVDSTAEDEGTDVVAWTAVLDDTACVDTDSSEIGNGVLDDTSCMTEEVAIADEDSWSGTNVDEEVTGVLDSTAVDESTEVVGWTAVLDDTVGGDVDSSEIANRIPDDTSFTTEEAAIGDEDSWSATNIDEVVTVLVDSTAVDESTEVVGCTTVLDDTVGGDGDSSEVANRIPDDTSCTTEEVAVADENSWSGTNVDEDVNGVVDSTAEDESTEVVGWTAVLDDTACVDTDSSEAGNRIPDDTSFTTEEVAVADEDSWSGTNVDEDITGVVDSTAADESTEVVGCTTELDDTGCVVVDSSEVANRMPDDTCCMTEGVANVCEDSWTGSNDDEDVTGVVDFTAIDESTEVVGCIAVLDDTVCVDIDSSEFANEILDITSCTTEEVANVDEDSWSATNGEEDVTGVATAVDEGTEVVGCIEVLDETACVGVDSSEFANGILDDTSCTTEEVASVDEDSWSGTDVDEDVTGVVDSTAVDESTKVFACTAVLDDIVCVDVDSSEFANVILDDTSCTTEEVAIIDEDCWSGTNVDEDVTGVVDSTAVDEGTEVVGWTAVLDDTVCVDVDGSEVTNIVLDDTSCTTEDVGNNDVDSSINNDVEEVMTVVVDSTAVDESAENVGFMRLIVEIIDCIYMHPRYLIICC